MKKNGFIATSLIYSFFLVFCALLVGYVGLYIHNKNLIDTVNINVKDELLSEKAVKSKLKVGDYVSLNLKNGDFTSNNFIVLSNNKTVIVLVSAETYQSANYYTKDAETNSYDYLIKNDLNYFSNLYLNSILPIKETDIDKFKSYLIIGDSFIYYKSNNPYLGTVSNDSSCSLDSRCSLINNNLYLCSKEINKDKDNTYPNQNIKVIITINIEAIVTSGDGTNSNPYQLRNYVQDGLILHFDSINPSGNKNINPSVTLNDLSSNNNSLKEGSYSFDNNNNIVIKADNTINLSNTSTIEFALAKSGSITFSNPNISYNSNTLMVNGTKVSTSLNEKNTFTITNNAIYCNGEKVLDQSNTLNGNLTITATSSFKSLRVYNKALSADEVRNNYVLDKGWLK